MDSYAPKKTPIKSDTNINKKRSYKVDCADCHVFLELYDSETIQAVFTIESVDRAIDLGGRWVDFGLYDHNGVFFDCKGVCIF